MSGPAQRFWARVDIRGPDECWPWKAGKRRRAEGRDYGVVWFSGSREQAHRVAFFLTHGHWPENARHQCDNPPCCNPAHVLDGNHADNMADKVERDRQVKGTAVHRARLTEADVRAIRADPRGHRLVAKDYATTSTHICRVRSRKLWKHVL
jgi:hypothetical protein